MISIELAQRLRDAGLAWEPANGDWFFIPGRDLDDRLFLISEMTVDVRTAPAGRVIAFNGTVEWALDAIMQREVIWLPSEAQLRERLGPAFAALTRANGEYCCEIEVGGQRRSFSDPDAAEAYGHALLHVLAQER